MGGSGAGSWTRLSADGVLPLGNNLERVKRLLSRTPKAGEQTAESFYDTAVRTRMKILFRELTKLSDIVSEAQESRKGTVSTSPVRTRRSVDHSMVSSSEVSKAVAMGKRKRLAQTWFAAAASLN